MNRKVTPMRSAARKAKQLDAAPPPSVVVLGKVTPEQSAKMQNAHAHLEALKRDAQRAVELAVAHLNLAITEVERDTGMRLAGKAIHIAEDGTVTVPA